jgi:hypothetical protein
MMHIKLLNYDIVARPKSLDFGITIRPKTLKIFFIF